MDFAVLVKAVPALESLRYDPGRRAVVRAGTELFLNPFDQRALRVALDLRRSGETVTVVSLGPPEARAPLRDAVALGADRTLLLSDPRCAGSDTLATARALAGALQRVGHDLTLAGVWSTDSETGQVGPEVAALLGVPVLSQARAIAREPGGIGVQVTVDTSSGWARYDARVPLLVTVGEKIAKPGKVSPEERARVPESAVELLSLDDVAVSPDEVGEAGSPTVVRTVLDDAPTRSPFVVSEGTPRERVDRAVEALRPYLVGTPPRRRVVLTVPSALVEEREVLVLVTDAHGALQPAALPLLSEVLRSLPGYWPSAVWVGGPPPSHDTARLARAGAVKGYSVPLSPLPSSSSAVALALGSVLARRPRVAAGLFLSEAFGRETAGQLAALRSIGLTGDAIEVRPDEGDALCWSKPSFGGRTVAQIVSRTRPSLATVRPGVWDEGAVAAPLEPFGWTVLPALTTDPPLTPVDSGSEVAPGTPDLEGREVVVAVGMGVGGPAGVAALAPLLVRWDAALGATRRVVDAGWVPRQFQVGLTGRLLAPRLGVLLGIGGAPNHLVGWRRARALLAVNRDPAAPVFREVDVGIVGTLDEIVPLLADALAPLLGR